MSSVRVFATISILAAKKDFSKSTKKLPEIFLVRGVSLKNLSSLQPLKAWFWQSTLAHFRTKKSPKPQKMNKNLAKSRSEVCSLKWKGAEKKFCRKVAGNNYENKKNQTSAIFLCRLSKLKTRLHFFNRKKTLFFFFFFFREKVGSRNDVSSALRLEINFVS